ncbi:MAG TPA: alpha/beta hydrolase [Allosphingosinicella sp.]|nr:alpha/beta hydrolase [Allosphingosinicella sp.]
MKPVVARLLVAFLIGLCPLPAFAQSGPPGQMVELNGIRMHYQVRGTGEPLLLLHGFGACGADWAEVADVLAEDYRVIIPDLRGHGWSTNPSDRFTMRQSSEDIAALLDHLGLQRVKAMGISAGGMNLLHLATREPDRIETLVLIGASTHFPQQTIDIMRQSRWENLPPFLQDMYRSCASRGDAQARELVRQFGALKDNEGDMAFTPEMLGSIRARTLIVHGDRDEFFPVSIPVDMYRSITGSQLWIVPNGDHVPIYGDRTAEFLRLTRAFLRGPGTAPQ